MGREEIYLEAGTTLVAQIEMARLEVGPFLNINRAKGSDNVTIPDLSSVYQWVVVHWKLWGVTALLGAVAKAVKMWFDLRKAKRDLDNSRLEGERLKAEITRIQAETERVRQEARAELERFKAEQLVRERALRLQDLVHCMQRDEADTMRKFREEGHAGTLVLNDDVFLNHYISQGEDEALVREALQRFKENKKAAGEKPHEPERWQR